jgi:pimeloyl-ACP methyl ester carboxylesterase
MVVLLHGQGDNRAGMLNYVSLFLRNDYSVLNPDMRAHGESGGELATYGVTESEDVGRWINWLAETEKPQCLFGLGESMGAAIVLQALRTEPGFCAVVAESSFSSFREIAYDRAGTPLGSGATLGRTLLRPGVEAGFLYARIRYGIDFDRAEPARAVAASRVPLLLIHGLEDISIPPRHSRIILETRPQGTEFWEAEGTGHSGALGQRADEFERRVTSFFAAHSLNQSGITD